MISRIEPTLDEKLQHEGSEDIKKFLKIAEEQANINSQIIEALSSPNINRETKQQMVEILTDGAKNSSFFRSVAQEKKKDVDFGIHETIPARGNVADKFHKFKNMVVGFHAQLNPTITFRNPMNPDWYEVGHKVGMIVNTATLNTKTTYNNISSFFKKIAENAQVLYKQAELHLLI